MCTMALLHRALAASKAAGGSPPPRPPPAAQPGQQPLPQPPPDAEAGGEAAAYADHRMPQRLVAIAGVYDIASECGAAALRGQTLDPETAPPV